jgi:hypothetical protein
MKKTVIMCDPPSGWKYGFPKPIPQDVWDDKTTLKWLLEEGYPQHEIDALGDHFHCRYWEEEIDEL